METRIVLVTFPNAERARQIGTALVEEQLVACANIVPVIESIYRWEDSIQHENETLAVFKTTSAAYEKLEARILELHPYENPEILAIEPSAGAASYLGWVGDSVKLED